MSLNLLLFNGAATTPQFPLHVGRDFFMVRNEELNVRVRGGDMQSVLITAPSHPVPLDACALAAQLNSSIGGHTHSTQATTNHLEVVAEDTSKVRSACYYM